MRWIGLSCVLLLGCGFGAPQGGPGTDAGGDGPGTGDAGTDGDGSPSGPPTRRLEVVDAQVAGGPHTDFPLLVSLTENWLRTTTAGGDVTSADGFDIGFFADAACTMRLAHQIELYDSGSGTLVAWVKVPSLSGATELFLRYGDPSITTSQQDIPGVWSNGYSGVWHMGNAADSTINDNDGTDSGSTNADGQIGNARSFDGTNDFIDVGSGGTIDDVFNGGGTIETWFNAAGWGEDNRGRFLEKGALGLGSFSGWSFSLNNNNVSASVMFAYGTTSGGNPLGVWNAPANSVALNMWTHVAVVYDRGSVTNDAALFINGMPATVTQTATPSGSMTSDAPFNGRIGNRANGDRTFHGMLDEVRLSTAPRNADWILTTFRNQSAPAAFLDVSNPL